jgi:hypothetical protein
LLALLAGLLGYAVAVALVMLAGLKLAGVIMMKLAG